MKKIILIVITTICASLLITMGNALAFSTKLIKYGEFRIEGDAVTNIVATGDYLGKSPLEGYLVELDGVIVARVEIKGDFGTSEVWDIKTPYYCELLATGYDWSKIKNKNKLVASDTSVNCFDLIGQQVDPFLSVTGCKMVLIFNNKSKFSGTMTCVDEVVEGFSGKFKGKFKGTRMGTYNPEVFQQLQ